MACYAIRSASRCWASGSALEQLGLGGALAVGTRPATLARMDAHAPDRSAPRRAREWVITLLVMAVVGVVAGAPELLHPQFYFHDDMQLYFVPHIVEIGRQLRAGLLPLLSEYSWLGGALAGEYQPALFSVPHLLLCWALAGFEPASIASTLSIGFIALAGGGAYRAARLSDFSVVLALSIAGVAALNGFNLAWSCWLPAITAWTWLMWSWWALVRLRRSQVWRWSDVAGAALCIYATLAAGWPTITLLVVPLALYVHFSVPAGTSERLAAIGAACALVLGGLLAAPALLSLVEFTRESGRSEVAARSWAWTVPLGAIKGLVAPLSSAKWSAFGTENLHQNRELAGGVLPPLVVLATLLFGDRAKHKLLAIPAFLSVAVLVWSMLPGIPPFRWPFRWLPAVHVLLVIAAAQLLRSGKTSPTLDDRQDTSGYRILRWSGILGIGLVALIVALEPADLRLLILALVAVVSCSTLILARSAKLDASLVFGVGVLANMAAPWLLQPRRVATPYWTVDACAAHLARTPPSDLYFGLYPWGALMTSKPGKGRGGCLAPGNLPMVFQRHFIGGYSPLMVEGLNKVLDMQVHGELGISGLRDALETWARPGSLFDRWGVAGLVVPKASWFSAFDGRLAGHGWQPVEDVGDGMIWRRKELRPKPPLLSSIERVRFAPNAVAARSGLLLYEGREWLFVPSNARSEAARGNEVSYASAAIELHASAPPRVEARVKTSASAPALVVLHRPYYPGYRATFDGAPLELGRADAVLVAFELPPGRDGNLVIEYAPWGTRPLGVFAAAAGLAALLAAFGYDVSRSLRRRAAV
jgi:hypothetical protein